MDALSHIQDMPISSWQVRPMQMHPDRAELKAAEQFAPEREPQGVLGVLQRHPMQVRVRVRVTLNPQPKT